MKTYAESLNLTEVMISGLKANSSRVQKRGLGNDFSSKLEKSLTNVKKLNNEQETLKANLKTKTEELKKEMEAMNKLISEGKKVVKLEFEQSQWKEFGIEDKR